MQFIVTGKYSLGDDYADKFDSITSLAYALIEIDQLAFNATFDHVLPESLKIETEV